MIHELKNIAAVENLYRCNRLTAIFIALGKMYLSDCNHQECYEMFCEDMCENSGFVEYAFLLPNTSGG